MSGLHMTTAFRRTVERRNKRVWWPILPTEIRAKRAPFRLIAPLDEKRTAYLAKKLTFATPGPDPLAIAVALAIVRDEATIALDIRGKLLHRLAQLPCYRVVALVG